MTKPSDTLTTLTLNRRSARRFYDGLNRHSARRFYDGLNRRSARRFYDGLNRRSARRFYDGLNREEKQFSRTAFGFPIRIDLSHYPSPT